MITKRDCILLLSELSATGVDVNKMLQKAVSTTGVDIDVIKFINDHRPFDAHLFYEKLPKSYNNKKSNLYKNIVTCDEVDCTDSVLTTLAALNLQILLHVKQIDNANMFLDHVRFEEITEVLLNYSKTYDLVPCVKVLQIIKADLKAFEYVSRTND